jgi:parvulin-like peptidyl-prolyl isomerase
MRVLLPAVAGAVLSFPVASALLRGQAAPAVPAPLVPTAPATQPGPDTNVITIDGQKVSYKEYDLYVEMLNPQAQQMARGPDRRYWADSYVNMRLLSREAARRQVDKSPDMQMRLAAARDQVLAQGLVVSIQETIPEAEKRKYFEDNKKRLERVSARHILIGTSDSPMGARPGQKKLTDAEAKAKAEQLIARIKSGEDFAQIALKESDDLNSAEDGGDLSSFTRGKMVPEFEQAVFALKENEVSAPVRTKFGYHIIQCTGRYDTYEKLQDVIVRELGGKKINDLITDMRKQTKVELNESVFGPPAPMFPPGVVPGSDTPK